jgi:phage tail sheath protein FI
MPVVPSYPGVYIEEIPSGVRTISSIATSITAFIGRALRGPVNEPILINSYGDCERTFGGLWVDSTLGYAVRDFYMNGGSQAVIVRLYHPAFSSQEDRNKAEAAAQELANAAKNAATNSFNNLIKNPADQVKKAIKELNSTNLQEWVTAAKIKAQEYQSGSTTSAIEKYAAKLVWEIIDVASKKVGSTPTKDSVLNDLDSEFDSRFDTEIYKDNKLIDLITQMVNQVRSAVRDKKEEYKDDAVKNQVALKLYESIESIRYNATVTEISSIADKAILTAVQTVAPITKAILTIDNITLEAAYPGAWGNDLQAQIDYDTGNPNDSNLFNLSVKLGEGGDFETFRNVSMKADHSSELRKVLESSSKLVRVKSPYPESTRPEETKKNEPLGWVAVNLVDKAGDGGKLESSDFDGKGKEGKKQGLYALEKADLFSLLCIPPYTSTATGLDVEKELIDAAIAYCKKRRAMLIIDAPSNWLDKETAKKIEKVGATSENAALFFPRLKQPNPLKNNQIEVFAACGAVAGVFSRTDTQRGIWKAPAGLDATLVGVPELSVPLTDAEIGELNPLGINCLRTIPAAGRVIWGSRTRKGDDRLASEWKYISVRRLAREHPAF